MLLLPAIYPACRLDLTRAFAGHHFAMASFPRLLFPSCILIRQGRCSITVAMDILSQLISSLSRVGCDPESEARCDLPTHLPADVNLWFVSAFNGSSPITECLALGCGLGFCSCGYSFKIHRFLPDSPVSLATD